MELKMSSKHNFLSSLICIILIILISFPIHTKNLKTKVIIELLNNQSYSGRLFEVNQDEVIIYGNEKIQKIQISKINRIGIKRRSRFLTGLSGGFAIGALIGGIKALLTKPSPDAFYVYYSSHIFAGAFLSGILGMLMGVITSPTISKYKYYNYAKYKDAKKIKFLKKLRRKAN